jgi:hypothetical protein
MMMTTRTNNIRDLIALLEQHLRRYGDNAEVVLYALENGPEEIVPVSSVTHLDESSGVAMGTDGPALLLS